MSQSILLSERLANLHAAKAALSSSALAAVTRCERDDRYASNARTPVRTRVRRSRPTTKCDRELDR
jgi:hypothetical protein